MDNIYFGETYRKSRCLKREQNTTTLLHDLLDGLGYSSIDSTRRRWQCGDKTVVVCFADDFNVCGANLLKPPQQWFTPSTFILTDNVVTFAPEYTVFKVPSSYWGIFSYQPSITEFTPTRDLHLSINRGDIQRRLILDEFIKARDITDRDFLNYNAVFTNDKPILKRPVEFEQACASSWLNLVVETYAGDNTITFSEKTFRALVTPAPWVLFACRNAVQYLRSLNFDVLDDVIDHSYDSNFQTGQDGIEKIQKWISYSIDALPQIKNYSNLQQRCNLAAKHNQRVLAEWKKQWPADFGAWLVDAFQILNR